MTVWKRGRNALYVLVVLAAAGLPQAASAANSSAKGDSLLVLEVSGMSCGGCAAHVQETLSGLSGVKEAKVSFAAKEARVRLAKPTSLEKTVLQRVKKAGYGARVKAKTSAEADKRLRSQKSSAS